MSKMARWRLENYSTDGKPACKTCYPTKGSFERTRISARWCLCKLNKKLDEAIVRRVADLLGQQGKEEGK